MVQKPVEVILMRQLASCLATPIFLVDMEGTLIFYNEPAETVLGLRFEETGEMPHERWATTWSPTALDGSPLAPEELPLSIALEKHRTAHLALRIRGLDGVPRRVAVTAFPLEGQGGRHLGAVAIFWEDDTP